MEKEDIIVRIAEGLRVIATWPNPMSKLNIKCSHPEIIRDAWSEYDNLAVRGSLRSKFIPDARQNQEAEEVIEWLQLASKRYNDSKSKNVVRAILIIRASNYGDRKGSFSNIGAQLKEFGIDKSKWTIQRLYDKAIDDIWFNIKH